MYIPSERPVVYGVLRIVQEWMTPPMQGWYLQTCDTVCHFYHSKLT